MEPSKVHIRRCLLFLFNSGKNSTQARGEICKVYGDAAIGISAVKNWFAKFRKGEFELDDKPRSGRPKETEDEELQEALHEDATRSTRELARRLSIDHSTVLRRLKAMNTSVRVGESGGEDAQDAQAAEPEGEPKEKVTKKRKLKTQEANTVKKKKPVEKERAVAKETTEAEDKKEAKKPKKRRKKKTITDVLATSEPAPGSPADLRSLVQSHFSDTRSVIEQEELSLPESCFLMSNDLTHSLSSYLKEVCPKWAKIQKQHTQTRSVALLIVCSSALRTIELIKQLTTFKGEARVLKLFAKHLKVEDQMKLLGKSVVHIGVGTPGRLSALIQKEGLSLQGLRYLVLDWNYRDQKQRRLVDIPEVKGEFLKLLETGIIKKCRDGAVKIALF